MRNNTKSFILHKLPLRSKLSSRCALKGAWTKQKSLFDPIYRCTAEKAGTLCLRLHVVVAKVLICKCVVRMHNVR